MHMPHKQNMIGSVRGLRSPPPTHVNSALVLVDSPVYTP